MLVDLMCRLSFYQWLKVVASNSFFVLNYFVGYWRGWRTVFPFIRATDPLCARFFHMQDPAGNRWNRRSLVWLWPYLWCLYWRGRHSPHQSHWPFVCTLSKDPAGNQVKRKKPDMVMAFETYKTYRVVCGGIDCDEEPSRHHCLTPGLSRD